MKMAQAQHNPNKSTPSVPMTRCLGLCLCLFALKHLTHLLSLGGGTRRPRGHDLY